MPIPTTFVSGIGLAAADKAANDVIRTGLRKRVEAVCVGSTQRANLPIRESSEDH
jgi:hypothetical protein